MTRPLSPRMEEVIDLGVSEWAAAVGGEVGFEPSGVARELRALRLEVIAVKEALAAQADLPSIERHLAGWAHRLQVLSLCELAQQMTDAESQ